MDRSYLIQRLIFFAAAANNLVLHNSLSPHVTQRLKEIIVASDDLVKELKAPKPKANTEYVLHVDADQLQENIDALRYNVEQDSNNDEAIRLLAKYLEVQAVGEKAAANETV